MPRQSGDVLTHAFGDLLRQVGRVFGRLLRREAFPEQVALDRIVQAVDRLGGAFHLPAGGQRVIQSVEILPVLPADLCCIQPVLHKGERQPVYVAVRLQIITHIGEQLLAIGGILRGTQIKIAVEQHGPYQKRRYAARQRRRQQHQTDRTQRADQKRFVFHPRFTHVFPSILSQISAIRCAV